MKSFSFENVSVILEPNEIEWGLSIVVGGDMKFLVVLFLYANSLLCYVISIIS